MNCIPLIPVHDTPFETLKMPAAAEVERLRDFAAANEIGLTVVGPEVALAAGVVDAFKAAGNDALFDPKGPHYAGFDKALRAVTGDPDNADFLFNLAVSLDHLHQNKLAAQYYQMALKTAEANGATRPVSFDRIQVRVRISELQP